MASTGSALVLALLFGASEEGQTDRIVFKSGKEIQCTIMFEDAERVCYKKPGDSKRYCARRDKIASVSSAEDPDSVAPGKVKKHRRRIMRRTRTGGGLIQGGKFGGFFNGTLGYLHALSGVTAKRELATSTLMGASGTVLMEEQVRSGLLYNFDVGAILTRNLSVAGTLFFSPTRFVVRELEQDPIRTGEAGVGLLGLYGSLYGGTGFDSAFNANLGAHVGILTFLPDTASRRSALSMGGGGLLGYYVTKWFNVSAGAKLMVTWPYASSNVTITLEDTEMILARDKGQMWLAAVYHGGMTFFFSGGW